ncbi:MAG: di-trans,poly-cis-decaprenylcistransferase, partial [Elusimicrobiaceae bacterium]|nr:di-trans,poly-cis-decaprenylcistransferase [Elusimicrobiaceae bacterium]
GRRIGLPSKILNKLDEVIRATAGNKKLTLNLCLNYGARQEITDAVNELLTQGKTKITEKDITNNLYQNLPEPDLIIRTSGEERLSNFLLWQAAYSEFYFTKTLWPDFKGKDLLEAISAYTRRERRFGARK